MVSLDRTARGSARKEGGRRWPLIMAAVAMVIALFAAAFFVAAVTSLVTCGGDGGSPYAAPASPRGTYCDWGLPWISLLAGLVVGAVGAGLAAANGSWRALLGCAVASAALVLSPLLVGTALSKECDDEPAAMTAEESQRYLKARPECAHY